MKFAKNAQSTFTIRGAPTGVPSWEFTTNTWETWSFDLQANWWRLFPSALSLARTGALALSIVQIVQKKAATRQGGQLLLPGENVGLGCLIRIFRRKAASTSLDPKSYLFSYVSNKAWNSRYLSPQMQAPQRPRTPTPGCQHYPKCTNYMYDQGWNCYKISHIYLWFIKFSTNQR